MPLMTPDQVSFQEHRLIRERDVRLGTDATEADRLTTRALADLQIVLVQLPGRVEDEATLVEVYARATTELTARVLHDLSLASPRAHRPAALSSMVSTLDAALRRQLDLPPPPSPSVLPRWLLISVSLTFCALVWGLAAVGLWRIVS
jgi:hypothetical protein